jgi:drug/metabolite transporter (DMT)-like permease
VGQAVAIQFQYVWMAAVLQHAVERSRPNIWIVISVFMILLGTVLGSGLADEWLGGSASAGFNPMGVLLALFSATCYAVFIYLNGKVAPQVDAVNRSFFITASGIVVTLVCVPGVFGVQPAALVELLPAGLVMGLLMNVIPIVSLAVACKNLPGGVVAIFTSLELPAAVASGVLILGEGLTVLTITGVLLICASVAISQVPEFQAARQRTPITGNQQQKNC